MLHATQNRVYHLIERAGERRAFPTPGMTTNTPSVYAGRQTRQPNAIIILHVTSSGRASLPELPAHINLASISLMAMALLALGLTDEPLTAGMGLLTFMAGFELWYHSLEQAIITIGSLVVIDFLISTITAYLTIAHHLRAGETQRRRLT